MDFRVTKNSCKLLAHVPPSPAAVQQHYLSHHVGLGAHERFFDARMYTGTGRQVQHGVRLPLIEHAAHDMDVSSPGQQPTVLRSWK